MILIELIITLILIGLIGGFTGLFLYTGVTGFLTSKKISETALKAQAAMDRITIELRDIKRETNRPILNSTSITYQSDDADNLPGTRSISYNSSNGTINLTVDGTPYVLLDQIQPNSFNLSWTERDLNNLSADGDELAEIQVVFKVVDVGTQFTVRVYPRNMVKRYS
ncbi:MAG: hypothetical protein R6V60_15995 [Desulfobacterales bacterium]